MGMSPSADLYWGFDLGNMTDSDYESTKPAWMKPGDDDERDWEEELAARLGWQKIPFPKDGPGPPRYSANPATYDRDQREHKEAVKEFRQTGEYKAWSDNRHQMRELIKDYPIELDTYGYSEEPQYCVRVKPSVQLACDWGSVELKPLEVDPTWPDLITEFMRLLELPIPDGAAPGWHMNCSYG